MGALNVFGTPPLSKSLIQRRPFHQIPTPLLALLPLSQTLLVGWHGVSSHDLCFCYLDAADGRRTPRTQEGAIGKNGQSPRLHESELAVEDCHRYSDIVRTTDEKKEILGTMLGNVDALVEGVRKAGIWGLS